MATVWGQDFLLGTKSARAILVTGGTGFIGSAVLAALLGIGRNGSGENGTSPRNPGLAGVEVRVLTRRPLPEWMIRAGVQEIRGDLLEPATLRGVCKGVATVLHLATHIGDDEDLCDAVNNDGTRVLLEEARTSGVDRVVHVSTTAIYGHGVHRGATESFLPPAPVSATSRSRLKAERLVRQVGGIVLRPHLVYGVGDRWFLPTLLRLLDRVPAWIERGGAMTSLVSVDDLAAVVAALTGMPWGPSKGAVYHVSHPQPVSFRAVTERAYGELGLKLPEDDLPAREHRELTRRVMPRLTDHQFELLAYDHWYNSSRIWQYTGVNPGVGAVTRLPAATSWYRTHVPAAA